MPVAKAESNECLALVRAMEDDGRPIGPAVELAESEFVELYELMTVTRQLDQELMNLQRQGQLALYPPCRGQEAAQVGCTFALRDDDWLFPQYRELGVFVARGVDAGGVGLGWRGTWHGGIGLVERNVAPISIPIGTQALHAVGAAMASKLSGDGAVAVGFVGDGATSEGDFHEALNFAAVFDAPCLFFVQNNQWAISVPVADQFRAASIAHKATGYGMPGIRVDGNDVLACLRVVEEAAARARAGHGPSLIEAVTYRMGPHTTADDPSRYRSADEAAAWGARDPIGRFRGYLEHLGVWSEEIAEHAEARAVELCRRLRDVVFDAEDVDPLTIFDHVFAGRTPDLDAQAELLADELAREG